MADELYTDGISEITVTGPIVRIDLMSLSATERDARGNPKPVLRQRIIMPVDAFANSVDVMNKALNSLVETGAVRRTNESANAAAASDAPEKQRHSKAAPAKNTSPNFS
ncbi:MAG: hypothetical protein KF874_03345 [Rhizobiaceae bacterium]|nr:hypothetical protein [Rhizobiaceae bacterium]